MAHVVLLMLDATEGVVTLDTTIAGYAHRRRGRLDRLRQQVGRDEGQSGQKKNEFEQRIRDQFKFLDYAPIVFLSAKDGAGVGKLFKLIREVYDSASRRITTGELNRFVANLHFEERKIYYITQHS
jgi:GTPase